MLEIRKRTAGIQIGGIVLDPVSDSSAENNFLNRPTGLTITDDSNIGQSLSLIMLLQLECDLLNPSMNLSILSPRRSRIGCASDERAEARKEGKLERLLQSYPQLVLPS